MMPPITWHQRLVRQIFPRRNARDCCLYHRQNLHLVAAAVNTAYQQMNRLGLEGDDADDFIYQFLDNAGLTKAERMTAILLLDERCGIWVSRLPGERRWTYQDGRHRARALMDAGVRRILIRAEDDRRYRD
jgi:hypothetical protein